MEPNLPVIARRVWSVVRVMFFMVRKGISKRLMLDLNMMMKRGKIAGKAIHNLMLHHWSSAANRRSHHFSFPAPRDYEFSCSNSPALTFPFHLGKRTKHHSHFFPCSHAPPTDDDAATVNIAVKKAVEMMLINSEAASPALPGFGWSPMVRQLRITDSPFLLPDGGQEVDIQVDEAAEAFIMKFYNDLRKQNVMG